MDNLDNPIAEYAEGIWSGKYKVGKWVRLLYERIEADLAARVYFFDYAKANKAIRFIEKFCRHNKGALAPRHLRLQVWQKAAIAAIFGCVDVNGYRWFHEVFLVVGRKMGKTLLAAAIMAYMAYGDGEYGAEIYCVAPKLDQADLVYSAFKFNIDHEPAFASRTRARKNDLYIESSNTSIRKIAFNERKADGYNPHLTVCDEGSSWPGLRGLRQYEVMVSGTGARMQPLTMMITSGGYEDEGIYDDLVKRATAFLGGDGRETRLLPLLYMIDDLQKWDDLEELRKSLPGLGVSVPEQFIRDQIQSAYSSPSRKVEFITKYACLKQSATQAWLKAEDVARACGSALRPEDFRHRYCVGGIDLSQTTDLTSCCVIVEKDGKLYVLSHFFLPRAKLKEAEARDGLPYDIYRQRGLLTLSGENFVDYHDCFNWFKQLVEEYEILPLKVGYDRYTAQYLVQEMDQYGFQMSDVRQGENLTSVINECEGLIQDGSVHIGDNDLLKVHLLDAALRINAESNRKKVEKLRRVAHIDGTVAMLDALCMRSCYHDEIGQQLKNAG